ncbi:MAG: trehalose-phosphatase [Beijerinckiaceae bacterium]|nr:trehalose-phosphatase [Beijerinckiaceae bacterium]
MTNDFDAPEKPSADPALFFDFDGTLVDIAATPDAVFVSSELRDALMRLRDKVDGALALVSGRNLATLDAHFAPLVFDAAGLHGLEVRTGGRVLEREPPSHRLRAAVENLRVCAAQWPQAIIEDKSQSVAVHWRLAPESETQIRDRLEEEMVQLGEDFRVQWGKSVAEILPVGFHKGGAIDVLMDLAPFAGRTPIVFGDDVTDEDAFRIVNARGGYSVKIGPEKTAATFRLGNARQVRALILQWSRELPRDVVADLKLR